MVAFFNSHKYYEECLMEALILSFLVLLFLCFQIKSALTYAASNLD